MKRRRNLVRIGSVVAVAAAIAATGFVMSPALASASSSRSSFTVTNGSKIFLSSGTFVVPNGVTAVTVRVNGGAGLASPIEGLTAHGGAGASIKVRLSVSVTTRRLQIVVGQGGQGPTPDNGGGGGTSLFGSGGAGFWAGGGGGASGVFVGIPNRADSVVVAGGGGGEFTVGGTFGWGGNGGTLSPGGNGSPGGCGCGATETAPGAGGGAIEIGSPPVLAPGGGNGVGPHGGNGGGLPPGPSNGCGGQGGGGGGGGYYGGGGGGYCEGGGGGSSFVASGSLHGVSATLVSASLAPIANGSVTVVWG